MKKSLFALLSLIIAAGLQQGCSNGDPQNDSTQLTSPESGELTEIKIGSTRNPHRMGDIMLAGQPSEKDIQIAADMGIKTVISLRQPDEVSDYDEPAAVKSAGMDFEYISFGNVDELTDTVFAEVRQQLKSATGPVLLHCSSANRVGAVWIPYRVLDEGISLEQATAEAKEIGLRTSAYLLRAEEYIKKSR